MFHVVSIHALLAECDTMNTQIKLQDDVSIHALLAECDLMLTVTDRVCKGFNPRTPCGVRRYPAPEQLKQLWFQSTHSLRSATATGRESEVVSAFQSTHSLRSATRNRAGI